MMIGLVALALQAAAPSGGSIDAAGKWGVDYKLGPKAVYDKYGPQPGDPSPEEIAAAAAEIKRDHIRSKMVSPSDFPAEEQEDDEE